MAQNKQISCFDKEDKPSGDLEPATCFSQQGLANDSVEISTGTASGAGLEKETGSIDSGTAHFNPRPPPDSIQSLGIKLKIPKLKLEVLPNYHKKSEKSLNESLLAVYNEKHAANVAKKVF